MFLTDNLGVDVEVNEKENLATYFTEESNH